MDGDNSQADYHLPCAESILLSELSEAEGKTRKRGRFHRAAADEKVAHTQADPSLHAD